MSRKAIIVAAMLSASTVPADAAARIYCAASDQAVKMSIESGFAARDGKRLVHFRGMADIVGDEVPAVFDNLKLTAAMLKQAWMDGDELRLQVYTDTRDARPFQTFELSITTKSVAKDRDRFDGRYVLTISNADKRKKAPHEVILSHEAPIFCEIK
ncbi:hypothetical protein [Rhizobium arsenicireducens]